MDDLLGMWVHPLPWSQDIEVLLDRTEYPEGGVKKRFDAKYRDGALTFHESRLGQTHDERSFRISRETAQKVFESLWAAGLRPNGGRDAEGVHAAQKEHIGDLRKMVELLGEAIRPRVYTYQQSPPDGSLQCGGSF